MSFNSHWMSWLDESRCYCIQIFERNFLEYSYVKIWRIIFIGPQIWKLLHDVDFRIKLTEWNVESVLLIERTIFQSTILLISYMFLCSPIYSFSTSRKAVFSLFQVNQNWKLIVKSYPFWLYGKLKTMRRTPKSHLWFRTISESLWFKKLKIFLISMKHSAINATRITRIFSHEKCRLMPRLHAHYI